MSSKQLEISVTCPESNAVKHKYHQMLYALGANLMMTCYGLVFSASGFMIPQLEDPVGGFGIDKNDGSWLASIMVIGSCTGAICGGFFSERFGRKKLLLFECTVFIFATLLCALAPNFKVLLISRVILGHCSASAMTSVPVYTSEISQPEVRTITGCFNVVCCSFGVAFSLMLGASLPWRYAIGSGLIIPISSFIILFFCPESPPWLISKGRLEQAKLSLEKLRGANHTQIIDAEMFRISTKLQILRKGENEPSMRYLDLLMDSKFLKPFGILLFVFCIGLKWTGLVAIAFYIVPFLMSAEIPIDPYWGAVILTSIRFFLALIALFSAKRLPRKLTYIACQGLSALATSMIGIYFLLISQNNFTFLQNYISFRMIPIFAILLLYVAFVFGVANIPFILQSELLPLKARSFGCALIGLLDNLSLFLSAKMVPSLEFFLGTHGMFFMHSCISIFVGITCFFIMPETKGMTLEEIEDLFSN